MPEYVLRAEYNGITKIEEIWGNANNMPKKIWALMVGENATELEVQDADAAISAIPRILNLAKEDEIWAKGRITIERDGVVVKEMPGKDE